jgi:hypothetical protein
MLPEFLADMDLPALSWGMSKRAVSRMTSVPLRKPRCLYPPDITKEECFDIQISGRQYAIMKGTLSFRFVYNRRLTSIVFQGVARSPQEEGAIISRLQQLYGVPPPEGIDGRYARRYWKDVVLFYKELDVDGVIHYTIELVNPKDIEYFHEEFLSSEDYDAEMRRQARRDARRRGRSKSH